MAYEKKLLRYDKKQTRLKNRGDPRIIDSFRRAKRESRFLRFFGLSFVLLLSMCFMLIGAVSLEEPLSEAWFGQVFGLVGIALFIIFCRGAWMIASGTLTHLIAVDDKEFCWGFVDREKSINIEALKEIRWDESDGLQVALVSNDDC